MKKKTVLLFYFLASIFWLYSSDYILDSFVPEHLSSIIERSKEIFYILVTGLFIYYALKKTEELNVAKEDEQRLSTLINSMVDFVNFKDGEGRWIEANEFGLKLFQLENVDYRCKKDSELAQYTSFYHDALMYCETSDEEAWKNGTITRVEEVIPLPNGGTKTFDTIKVPLFYPNGARKGLVINGRDITDRKLTEKLLAESEQQYKSLFEYSPDLVFMIDFEGKIIELNPQFEKITGYEPQNYIGKKAIDFIPEHSKQNVKQSFKNVTENQLPQMFELDFNHKHGDKVILQCTSIPIIVDEKVSGIIGYGKDISSLRKAEERLIKTEKLSVVGELSASVAHEIRNPLTSLKGFVQLLQVDDEKHQHYYEIMIAELNRINHIVGELLLLAKPQKLKFEEAAIQRILNDVVALLNTQANLENVQIELIVNEDVKPIECEPNQLKQLFINLIKNGIEASINGGKVIVTVDKTDKDYISVIVKDNGCGISKERLDRIGEPFYSSKDKGTGLGLTVSSKIVQTHNGHMTFESEVNIGTTVTVQLPIRKDH